MCPEIQCQVTTTGPAEGILEWGGYRARGGSFGVIGVMPRQYGNLNLLKWLEMNPASSCTLTKDTSKIRKNLKLLGAS